MTKLQTFLLLVLFAVFTSGIKDFEKSIESADAAYAQFDLKKSRRILETILLTDTKDNEQKCEVLRRLAHQNWKYYKDYDLAKKRLMNADSIGNSKFDTWMLISRIERESMNFDNALNAAIKAEGFTKSNNEINLAKVGYAQTVYELSVNFLDKGNPLDENLLSKTSEILTTLIESDAGAAKPSKLLLGISLLNNDGENVLKAWLSYFHFQNIKDTYPYFLEPAEKFSKVCEKWSGEKLGLEDQEILIDALASYRFYEFIPAYVNINQNGLNYNQKTKDIITYSEYLRDVKEKTDEYYRLIAIEKESGGIYKKWLNNRGKELWNNLSFSAQKHYNVNDFLKEIEKHFGAMRFTGSTGNYSGYVLSLGHIVNQEKTTIDQYGYKSEFTYTQIDMMASNGYSSWFWENKAIGGWAADNEIIRIREAYLNGPFKAWETVTDTIEGQKIEEVITEFLNQSNTEKIMQSEGLATKLRFDALKDLHQKLYSNGLRGQELKLAFLSTFENYRVEASIFAHEGRHSIEQKYMPNNFKMWSSEVRELHAKLSQIVFAAEPRLELAGMVKDTGNSGHAKANQQIVDIAIEWIKSNTEKVIGFSEEKSEFSQIYLLSVEQIRECYKQADPLNK